MIKLMLKYFNYTTDHLRRLNFWYDLVFHATTGSFVMITSNIVGYSMLTFGAVVTAWRLILHRKNPSKAFLIDEAEDIYLSLKDALSIYANSISYKSNFDYNQKRFKQLWKDNDDNLIPQELFTLLQLVQDEKLTLYGRKSFSSLRIPLQPIPKEYLNDNNKHNWSDDYSTLYYDNSKDIAYTDISLKEQELKSLLDKVRNLYDY